MLQRRVAPPGVEDDEQPDKPFDPNASIIELVQTRHEQPDVLRDYIVTDLGVGAVDREVAQVGELFQRAATATRVIERLGLLEIASSGELSVA